MELVLADVALHPGDAQRAGGLEDRTGVGEHVLDRRTDLVGVDDHEVVDQFTGEPERLLADELDGGAVAEQPDVVERHPLPGGERTDHRVGVLDLDADHLDLRADGLDVGGDPRDQTAAADGDEDRLDRPLALAEQLHRDRPLPGDHVRVVERMDVGQVCFGLQRGGMDGRVGVAVAVEHDLRPPSSDRIDLDLRGGHRHDHRRLAPEVVGAHRHALGVVAGRRADHATTELLGIEPDHPVVRPAQLEAEHRLGVLPLEQDLVAQPGGEHRRQVERRLVRDVVDPGRQDPLQIVDQAPSIAAPRIPNRPPRPRSALGRRRCTKRRATVPRPLVHRPHRRSAGVAEGDAGLG